MIFFWWKTKKNSSTPQKFEAWSCFSKKHGLVFECFKILNTFCGTSCHFFLGIRVTQQSNGFTTDLSRLQLGQTAGVHWLLTKELGSPDMFFHCTTWMDYCWFLMIADFLILLDGCVDKWQSNCWIRRKLGSQGPISLSTLNNGWHPVKWFVIVLKKQI